MRGIAAEPSLLPHGEPAGASDDQVDGVILADGPVEMGDDFLVPEGLAGGAGEPGRPAASATSSTEPEVDHAVDPLLDPAGDAPRAMTWRPICATGEGG